MNIDLTLIECSCSKLFSELKDNSENLGYSIQVMYSKTDFEENQTGIIYVHAEYKNLLRETNENKRGLRKIIPRKYKYNGLTSKVKIEFQKLPREIQNKIRLARKSGRLVYF